MASSLVTEQLKQTPTGPGVYIMKDTEGTVLYVGKAASLRHRVRSYFGASQRLTPKTQQLVEKVNELEFFVTTSEEEALILENNLIKKFRPNYNVRLRDDKTYPYLKISLNEEWPRVFVTRRLEEDGGQYFGPFTSARSVRQTLKVLKGIFPFRSCTRTITGRDARPCLDYHIHNCLAPCVGATNKQEYTAVIKQVSLFLKGKQDSIVRGLESKMNKAAEALDFEKASFLRDQIQAIERVIEGQRIAAVVRGEQDVIAFASEKDRAFVQVFFVRSSRLVGRESFVLQGASSEEPQQVMSSFIKQFYSSAPHIPPLLLLQHPVEDQAVIEKWLASRRGAGVRIMVPSRGHKKQLMQLAEHNAEQGLKLLKVKQQADSSNISEALAEIQKELRLPGLPLRIECYDISNIQGTAAVGSMAVFENGKPKPELYRRFRIKTVAGADDYAMLQEVLGRRFKRNDAGSSKDSKDITWAFLPDLIVIDGGKGQLNSALSVLKEKGLHDIPIAGLAKENEEIFIPRQAKPKILPHSSPGLQLLQRIRDEAHRFALGYHHKLRQREAFTSSLDNIPGIGAGRRRALLKKFGLVQAIQEASIEELAATPGMNRSLAERIKEYS